MRGWWLRLHKIYDAVRWRASEWALGLGEWFGWLRSTAAAWWRCRNPWYLLLGAPALLLFLVTAVLAFLVVLHSGDKLKARYLQLAAEDLRAKNFPAARIAYQRLSLFDPDRPDLRYGLGLALQGQNQMEHARAIMDSVAPLGSAGESFGPAHFWLGQVLLSRKPVPPQELKAAEAHLEKAIEKGVRAVEAHAILGQVYLKTDRPDQAEKHLLAAAERSPDLAMLLSAYYTQRGDKAKARASSQRCARYFQARAEADPGNGGARLQWAQAMTLLGEHEKAVVILREGLFRSGAQPYRIRLADTYAQWVKALQEDPSTSVDRRLMLIAEGLKYNPNHLDLLRRLVEATKIEGPDADKVRESLEGLLAEGTASSTVHLFLGLDAGRQGHKEAARIHLDRAYMADPQMPVVANNLAVILVTSDPPQLEQALLIINTVLDRQPDLMFFRLTRGQVLARMGKWKEALEDLKPCAAVFPKHQGLHQALAETYAKLNMPDLAAEHQRLAESKAP